MSSAFVQSWRMPHVRQEMLTFSRTPEFTSFGEFMIHSFMIDALHNVSVLGLCLRINDSGLSGLVWQLCLGFIDHL